MKIHIILIFASLFVFCSWLNIENNETIPEGTEISRQEYTNTIHFTKKRIRHLMRKKHLPAFAITIVDDKDIIYQQAFGMEDMEYNTEASANTVFKLYSVAKLFTALEIFREVEEGLIDLDNSLLDYLPDFSIHSRNNDYQYITVKSILAHRSGLPRNECVLMPDAEHDINTLKKFELATAGCHMAFPVNYRYKYSNLGYNLLGRIIEENRHQGFSGFMRDHLLYDLGMKNSSFRTADLSDPKLIAKGYEYYKHKYYPMIQSDITNVPSGNLYSTIEDLSVFLKAMINNKIFKNQETMSRMFVDHYSKRTDPETMGLGLKTTKINGSELMVWHDGGPTDGVGTLVAVLPYRNLGIALVSNSTSFEGNISVPFAAEIFKHLLETKSEKDYSQSEKQERSEINRQLLSVYEGKYPAFGEVMDVKARRNKLKAKIGGFGLDLIPVNDTEFRVTHWIDRIGLTKILDLPIDFDKIKIEFQKYNSPDSCNMIINLDNITFEICQRYPDHFRIPGNWDDIQGEYRMAERLPDDKAGNFTGSHWTIFKEDNVLIMSGVFGPIAPLDEKSLIITSGPFAGETIEYTPESGNLVHQNAVFVPVK